MSWDEVAPDNSSPLRYKYYCKICEEFFELSPLSPTRCPYCFGDARYIIGPIPAKEIDINKLKRRSRR